jgi:arylsulfatase A-like enzyme
MGERTMPKSDKPNILIIWGDDIGWFNVSAYNHGVMGYRTPNIDRIAKEGCLFTDWYGQQSCTAGRAAFITGQSPIRTGLTKVGLPGADIGLQPEDPTIADVLKPLGYVCGQFGKNHLGDRNDFLPTVHGFDEFFGNLYHLNAEEEPENADYPADPAFRKRFGPRGVLHSWANADGTQKIEDTGPLPAAAAPGEFQHRPGARERATRPGQDGRGRRGGVHQGGQAGQGGRGWGRSLASSRGNPS